MGWRTSALPVLYCLLLQALVRPAGAQVGPTSVTTERPAYESPRLSALAHALDAGDARALGRFWDEVNGKAPLVEPAGDDPCYDLVTFVWRGSGTTTKVGLLGDLPYADRSRWYMRRLPGSDLWFKTERIPRDARFGYMLNENDAGYRPDPLNPRQWAGRSVAELPDAPDEPWIRELPGVARGTVVARTLRSAVLQEDRKVSVYLPAGYDSARGPYNVLVVFDGESYGRDRAVPTPVILDNLIARLKIPATVAVLVNSQRTRDRDLTCSEPFERFLVEELVPWARREYRATSDPTRTVVAGSSYGGLAATCAAFRHPAVFGNVLSQSGTFTYTPPSVRNQDAGSYDETGWLIQQFAGAARLPLRFYLQVGRFEGVLSPPTRYLRAVLEAKGYPVTFAEYSGGHDYLAWRDSLGEGLVALFGEQRLRW